MKRSQTVRLFFATKLLESPLVRSTMVLFSGTMLGNVFSYLFQVVMGRMLSVSDYGAMNALFAFMALAGVPFATVTHYLAKRISQHLAREERDIANSLILRSYRNIFLVGLVVSLIGAMLSPQISSYLQIPGILPVIFMCGAFLFNTAMPINSGVLQGFQAFGTLSAIAAGFPVLRVVFGASAVLLGFGLNGVLGATIVATFLASFLVVPKIKQNLRFGITFSAIKGRELLREVWPLLMGNAAFMVISQSDIILVKALFSPEEAGYYSSAAIVSKALMYLPGALILSLFPMVAANSAKQEGSFHLLIKALGLTALLSGSGALAFFFFSEMLVSMLFGAKFLTSVALIPKFVMAVFPMALLMVLMTYNMARGGLASIFILLIGAIVQVVWIYQSHQSLLNVLDVIFYCNLVLAVMSLALAYQFERKQMHRTT
ncbi:MAG: oligosaccharide flippase family protein [bacterium]|nr:oligosaccharide flippase family protein [bacterium]